MALHRLLSSIDAGPDVVPPLGGIARGLTPGARSNDRAYPDTQGQKLTTRTTQRGL